MRVSRHGNTGWRLNRVILLGKPVGQVPRRSRGGWPPGHVRQPSRLDEAVMTEAQALHLAEIADRPGPLPERAQAMLHELGRHVPFDASWMAMADPLSAGYMSLASTGLDQPTLEYLSGPKMAHYIVVTGTNRDRPPVSPAALPYPSAALPTWVDCLIPAGYHEGLGVALFCPPGRHV